MPLKTIRLPAGTEHVQFGELAQLIADALYPLGEGATDSEMITYGGARINLEAELKQAVKAGTLPVKDSLTFGPHTFPVGNALRLALVMVSDLRAFLAGRPVTVEIASTLDSAREPGFYTLDEAARAIAENLGWHDGARDTLKNQLMQAARADKVTVRHPHTGVPYRPEHIRDFYELVTPTDVNKWAASDGVTWRWDVSTPEPKAVSEETVEQRRARYLEMLEAEEKNGTRGALSRIAKREGVDRSNMAKDIAKARDVRAKQTRAGVAWFPQQVKDGKRR